MRRHGFTLIEVLISIVVMTIAFFAILAVQGSALTGYSGARDSTEATEILRTVIETLTAESQAWRNPANPPLPGATGFNDTYGADSPYRFDNLLTNIAPVVAAGGASSSWEWIHLNDAPMDTRQASEVEVTGRRYCIYARSAYVPIDLSDLTTSDGSGNLVNSPMLRVQVAVVYVGRMGSLANCDIEEITDNLEPTAAANEALELEGYRAIHGGTIVVRREDG
jgi:prepilin-type N-terminal cleavage/methylation domain-containing protein